MGVFGTGLYSGDFAMDLRATVRAVSRLPFPPDRLVDILRDTEPGAADDPANEDHTTFWLVVADQFARRGLQSPALRDRALAIIDGGLDLAMKARLGLQGAGLKKRGQVLDDLRTRLAAPIPARRPPVLARPQPLLFDVGTVVIYPTSEGRPINPYYPSKAHDKRWQHNGWGAMIIIDRGRAFDFLAWYRPIILTQSMAAKPGLDALHDDLRWKLQLPGVCSAAHAKKMELENLGQVPIDPQKVVDLFPGLKPGHAQAVNEISLANRMRGGPAVPAGEPPNLARTLGRPSQPQVTLAQIAADV